MEKRFGKTVWVREKVGIDQGRRGSHPYQVREGVDQGRGGTRPYQWDVNCYPKGKLDRRNGGGDVEKCPASCGMCLMDHGKGGREHEIKPGRTKIGDHDVDMGVLD